MKKILKILVSVLTIALIAAAGAAPAFASEGLEVNGEASLNKGDTLSYTLFLSDCEQPIIDLAAYLYYDSGYLELDADSLSFPELSGVSRNTELENCVPFVFSALSSPVDFSEKKALITVDFTAKKSGTTDISYFIGDMEYQTGDKNLTVTGFTFSCSYAVNGETVSDDAVPKLLDDKSEMDERQSGFINYADGRGENASGDEHIAVTGEIKTTSSSRAFGSDASAVIIVVFAVVIALAIAIIAILRKHFTEDEEKNQE